MNQTEKLKLNKPEDSDYFNIEDFNENADIIEKEILNNRNPAFTSAQKRENLKSNESLSALFGKIMKFFTDLKSIAFTGSYNDLSDTPGIFMKSGSGAKAGLVPAPPTTAGTGKYLREDGTWTAPPDANPNISDEWSASITYGVNAYVIYNNAMWKCKIQNSGQTPAEGTYWTKTNMAKECSLLNSNLIYGKHTCPGVISTIVPYMNISLPIDFGNTNYKFSITEINIVGIKFLSASDYTYRKHESYVEITLTDSIFNTYKGCSVLFFFELQH